MDIVIELTKYQNDLLFEATEVFHSWYRIWWGDESPSFSILLELNHTKINDMVVYGELTEEQTTTALKEMIISYKKLLNNDVEGLNF